MNIARGRCCFLVVILLLYSISSNSLADEFFNWTSNNIQILRGHDFALANPKQSIITLEHVHKHQYGDTFVFLDLIYPDSSDSRYYFEAAPRFSLSKLFDRSFSFGIVKDVLISTTFEKAKHQGPQYLLGGGVDLDLPYFKFFKANLYIHDSTVLSGTTWHSTVVWNLPFELAGLNLLAEGFADFQGAEGGRRPNQLIVPRLLVDISNVIGANKGQLMAGIEYQYWHNKFGLNGVTESVVQAQLKWTF